MFSSISHCESKQVKKIKSDFNIFYVGKFNHCQGLETLINAINQPKLHSWGYDIRLILVNNSVNSGFLQQTRIEKLVNEMGLANTVTFIEGATRKELVAYYAAADVCVVPDNYNFSGTRVVEAMASGTPVIAADVGGLKYIVEHNKSGLLFPSQNSFLLARAIVRLMTEPELRLKMGILAKERVSNFFTWDDIAKQISDFHIDQSREQHLNSLPKIPDSLVPVTQG